MVLAAVGTGIAAPTSDAAGTGTTYRCQLDVHGQNASGRIKFRRVVNTQVQVSRASGRAFGWSPISWSLSSEERWPGTEIDRYLVPSTDGKVRYVETEWHGAGGGLRVSVLRIAGRGFPKRLVAGASRTLYWLTADGVLHSSRWTGRRFTTPTTIPVTITGATAIAAWEGPNGTLVYVTDRTGALHVVRDEAGAVDHVVSDHGFSTVTGLKVGTCMSPDYVWVRSFGGILAVDRSTGIARFRRHLQPYATTGGVLTTPARVPPTDWTWRHLG